LKNSCGYRIALDQAPDQIWFRKRDRSRSADFEAGRKITVPLL